MRTASLSSLLLCLLLGIPAVWIGLLLWLGEPWRFGIAPSGDIAAKLLVTTLCLGPLRHLCPGSAWCAWLVARRRIFGLAAFGYAAVHLFVFAAAIGRLDWIIEGMAFASMSTGWLAFALLGVVAAISNGVAVAQLGRWWKRIQRLAQPAALLMLVHWMLLDASPWKALAHAAPLALLWGWPEASRLFRAAATRIVGRR